MRDIHVSCPVCRGDEPKTCHRQVGKEFFLSCPVCSFHFIHPFVESDEAFDDYSWTKDYTENYDRYLRLTLRALKKKLAVAEKLLGRKARSFLDVGCGNGLYLHAADQVGLQNLGIDVDKVHIAFAKAKGLNAVAGNLEDLDLEETYDIVHLKSVLHLVKDPYRFLAKAGSLMSPGGVVFIDVPNQGSLFSRLHIVRGSVRYGQLELPLRRGAYNYRCLAYLCDRVGLRIAKRVFIYPGDGVYYPILGINPFVVAVFRLFAAVRISSLLGIYAVGAEGPSKKSASLDNREES